MPRNPYDNGFDPYAINDAIDEEDERLDNEQGLTPVSRGIATVPATRVPDVTEYAKQMPVKRRDQALARRQLTGVALYTELQRAEKTLLEAYGEKEAVRRRVFADAAEFNVGLPHHLQKHKVECQTQVTEACRIYAAAVDLYRQERVDTQRFAAIKTEKFGNQMLRERIERQKLIAELERAGEISARQADARVAEAEVAVAKRLAEAFEHRSKGEALRAEQKEAERMRKAEQQEKPKEGADLSKTMREHMARSEAIHKDRRGTQAKINDIYLRAARERRQLTDDEDEAVDVLQDSLAAAEKEHKTSAAADLGLGEEGR